MEVERACVDFGTLAKGVISATVAVDK